MDKNTKIWIIILAIRQDTARFSARQPAKARQGNQGDYQPSGKVISVIRSKRKLF